MSSERVDHATRHLGEAAKWLEMQATPVDRLAPWGAVINALLGVGWALLAIESKR